MANHRSETRLPASHPYYLANVPVSPNADLAVVDKYTGEVATRVALADAAAIDRAIGAAEEAAEPFARWPAWRRKEVLAHVANRLETRREELARALAIEVGKPLRDARGEVTRAIDTFTLAAEESTRIRGAYEPLDVSERADGHRAIWKRVPVGPASFVTPFNFPLNLAAHKVAPALAIGCPFVLKPAERTPIGALVLGEILAETDLPPGTFSVLPCDVSDAGRFATDERLKHLSFTGSPEVGWMLKAKAGKKTVTLELGGNAACVVDRGADVARAVERLVVGAFYQSGQSCISVQRILAHRDVHDELRERLRAATTELVAGDPLDDDTFLGPLITEDDARRVASWLAEAVEGGATVLVGGGRDGAFVDATIVEGCPHDARLSCAEAFGPIATLEPFDDFDEALDVVDDGRYGLQAGIFTPNLDHAFRAFDRLHVGAVVVNDVPSIRVDAMPYGGVKDSGLGREGVRFAIESMSELRMMLLKDVGSRQNPENGSCPHFQKPDA